MISRLRLRTRGLLFADLILIAASVVGSFVLRLELAQFFIDYLPTALIMLGVAWVVKPLVYRQFGLYRRVWAYASMREVRLIVLAVTVASTLVTAILFALYFAFEFRYFSKSVFIIDWLLSIFAVGAVRLVLRMNTERRRTARLAPGHDRSALVIGAGDAGALVVRELQRNPQLHLKPLAYLDDDPEKQEHQIYGVPVVGQLSDLKREIENRPIDEVVVAIPSAPGSVLRQVAETCRQLGVPFRTMPGLYELIGGEVSVNRLREVEITDLLRRKPVDVDRQRVGMSLRDKRVLVTGAGGSIASELCRQVANWGPAELILLGHGENSIFEVLLELHEDYPALKARPVIADVRDLERLQVIFDKLHPEIVFHAAAHKHVPLMEVNVEEAVTNNILGTRNVCEVAQVAGVQRLVMISSDKAVRPSSVMGATKRIAEWIVLDAASRSGKEFSVVRFGNVLGSRGSVVPLFKRQIARGGPVTVTHPDIERYFMTIPEAVHLVLQAATMGVGGEVFVLNMGEPVRILQLAEDLIRLSGLEPGEDIEIVFSELRPGDKLSEELWDPEADYQRTEHPDIARLDEPASLDGQALGALLDELIRLAQDGKPKAIVERLDETIPGAVIRSTPPPDLTSLL